MKRSKNKILATITFFLFTSVTCVAQVNVPSNNNGAGTGTVQNNNQQGTQDTNATPSPKRLKNVDKGTRNDGMKTGSGKINQQNTNRPDSSKRKSQNKK
jgi:hypothetical protein